MSGEQLPLPGTSARRRRGRREQAITTTLRGWTSAGHLAGDDHAAARAVLRSAFENLDVAEHDRDTGESTAYAAAMALRTAHSLLWAWAPTAVEGDDDPLEHYLDE